jgi:hypothetical protein
MNGNAVGAKTLAYMRGERDVLVERQRLVELREQFNGSGLKYWLSNPEKPQVKKFWKLVSLLEENSRMTMTKMSKRANIPISTIFDMVKEMGKYFCFTIVLRDNERNIVAGNMSATLEFSTNSPQTLRKGKKYLYRHSSSASGSIS